MYKPTLYEIKVEQLVDFGFRLSQSLPCCPDSCEGNDDKVRAYTRMQRIARETYRQKAKDLGLLTEDGWVTQGLPDRPACKSGHSPELRNYYKKPKVISAKGESF